MKTPHTPFRMPPELKEAATAQAKREGLSLAQLVYKAIREYLIRAICARRKEKLDKGYL